MLGLAEHAIVINLASRPDRLAHCEAELAKIGVRAERFDAEVHPSGDGRIGCSLSHLRCLERAKAEGWPSVLICEDDIAFTDPARFMHSVRMFAAAYSDPASWDVLLLGGNMGLMYIDHSVDKGCYRVGNIQTATGYVVNRRYYDVLLENFRTGLESLVARPDLHHLFAVDMYWKRLQVRDRWFVLAPLTVTQYPNYSNIENRDVDYSRAMLRELRSLKP